MFQSKIFNRLLVLLVSIIFMVTLVGCTNSKPAEVKSDEKATEISSETTSDVSKDTLILGASSDFKATSAREGHTLVFDHFTTFAENLEIAPGLVASWDILDEGKTYILHLQKDVQFHNGEAFDANAAEFSLSYWPAYEHSRYPRYLSAINVIDEYTVEVTFNKPFSAFLIELAAIRATLPDSVDDKGNVLEWNGTGPFVLKEYQVDQKAILEVNENYWNDAKKPQIKKIEWITIPNENSRVLALKSGQVDAIGVTEHSLSIPYAVVPELENTPGIKLLKPSKDTINTTEAYVFNYKSGILEDINIRKAIVHAIDRETLTTRLFNDIPVATGHFLLPQIQHGPKNVQEYTYNVTLAQEALKEAGYTEKNANGFVEKNGKPLQLHLLTQNHQMTKDQAVFLQANLKEIGIDLVIEALEKNAFEEKAKAGQFDIAYTHSWTIPPIRYMQWRGLSDGYDNFGLGFKVDPRLETLVESILTSTDEKEVTAAWNEVWELQYNHFPGTSLFVKARVFAFKENISGLYFTPRVQTIDLSKVTIN